MYDMEQHTSEKLRETIMAHPQESRNEWILWIMERVG